MVAVVGPGGRTEQGREREAEMSTAAGREAARGGGGGSDRSGSRAGGACARCVPDKGAATQKDSLGGTGGPSVLVSEFFLCVASVKYRVDTIAVMETAHVFG
ncbi:hypothetical protein E2C01_065667 [Portunus trituberculatus]|uniref:Uncharacterized protein n=1 Tax=Portunus trituberculatus TaxID=210409 RepID=A0A5B7HNW2_PORTR|nr:hypothetical protein [Portunus trituberculatus]